MLSISSVLPSTLPIVPSPLWGKTSSQHWLRRLFISSSLLMNFAFGLCYNTLLRRCRRGKMHPSYHVLSIARIYIPIPGRRCRLSSRPLTIHLNYVCLPSKSYWSSSNHQSRRYVSIRYRHLYMSVDLTPFFPELLHRCAQRSTSHVRTLMPSLLYSSLGVLATGSCLVF